MNAYIIALLCAFGMTMAGWAFASDGGKHFGEHHHAMRMKMLEQLDLSDEQKQQAKEIRQEIHKLREQHRGMEAAAAIMELDPGDANYSAEVKNLAHEFAVKMEANIIARAEARSKLYAILEPQQREEFAKMEARMMEKRKSWFARRGEQF